MANDLDNGNGPSSNGRGGGGSGEAPQLNSTAIIGHVNDVDNADEGPTTITNELMTSPGSSTATSVTDNDVDVDDVGGAGATEEENQTDRSTGYDNLASSSPSPAIEPQCQCNQKCPDIPMLILEGETERREFGELECQAE